MNEAAIKQPPFAEFLGLKITHVSPERVTAELVARDDLNNRFGIMHGGALMALADNLGGTATTANLKPGQSTTNREQDQFFCGGANRRRCEGGMHAAAPRPHHHGLADAYHARRRQTVCAGDPNPARSRAREIPVSSPASLPPD